MTSRITSIVVLGAGYGGLLAALRLAGKTKHDNTSITLVSALDHFVERPRLQEKATGAALPTRPIPHMLRGSKAQFLQGWVTAIDPARQRVQVDTADGAQALPYDYLIYALGSSVDRHTVPGVDDYAYTLDAYGEMATDALHARLAQHAHRVLVVGAGATGIEAVTQVKGIYPHLDVSLVTQGEAGAFKGARVQKHIRQALQEQDITLYENHAVSKVERDGVRLDNGQSLSSDTTLWAAGFMAPAIAREAGLQVNKRNQILVDPSLRSLSHPSIYAVGDAAQTVEEPGVPMRMSVFVALVAGAQAADNIVALLKGKQQKPLSFEWYGQGIALGPRDAVGFGTYPADKVIGPIYRRGLAMKIRNFFLGFLGAVLEMERRFPGSFFWTGKNRYAKAQRRNQVLTESRLHR